MSKYIIYLNAIACASYEVEADNISEAYNKAIIRADLHDCEAADWMHEDFEIEKPCGDFATKDEIARIDAQ